MEDPNVEAIADLFGISTAAEPAPSGRIGRNADESRMLGDSALTEGRYTEALDHFRRALDQNPKDRKKAMLDLAEAFAYGDDEPQALKQYRKAQREFGLGGEEGVADLYKRFGRFSAASDELKAAIAREPENPLYRQKMSETLRDAGYPRAALKEAEAVIALAPDSSHAHFAVGELNLRLKDWQAAINA
ncbi:tetratricopeptide repeat protein, partial [bacterium]